jgi:uncharacterized protein with ATP-grasp and redox domains
MTSEPGSFARSTIAERKPQIIRQVIDDNGYPPQIEWALEAFKAEIASQPMHPLTEQVPDAAFWNRELAGQRGRPWVDAPWYFAESYFYRRLLEAVRYFQPGPWRGCDPFESRKHNQEQVAVDRMAQGWEQLAQAPPDVAFEALLHSSLWGNRADLSNYTVAASARDGLAVAEERGHILIDDTDKVRELLASRTARGPRLRRVDFVSDNVGLDSLFDLALADFLLGQGWVEEMVFHLKNYPFFVSDAMIKDVRAVISLLQASHIPTVKDLGQRMRDHAEAGRIVLRDDPFWTSSLMFRELPPALRAELARSDLIILKGDVNYRRLLDDRHWPPATPMEKAAGYFPTPFLVLRTLKGEIVVGLKPGQAEALATQDPTWLINGKRGIIHLERA